jgi:outer membrane protein assembly factor BamB
MRNVMRVMVALAGCMALALAGWAESRLVLLDDRPALNGAIAVNADGSRVYLNAGGQHMVFDAAGTPLDRFPMGGNALLPLKDGWFILSQGHAGIFHLRPDGTSAKKLVGLGGGGANLYGDMTGWTSPCGAAIDEEKRLIFVLDTSAAQRDDRNMPDPWYSRIGVWNFDGKFQRDIHKYDAFQPGREQIDDRRVWYYDLDVDPKREVVYAAVRNPAEIWAFKYDGTLLKKAKAAFRTDGMSGALCVLPDGRIAAGGGAVVQIFTPDLQVAQTLPMPAELNRQHFGVRSLACDAAGRLYAACHDLNITFIRWSADLVKAEVVGPRYLKLQVTPPTAPVTAGQRFTMPVQTTGNPQPGADGTWSFRLRPADGSDLRWRTVPCALTADGSAVAVTLPDTVQGVYHMALRYGNPLLHAASRGDEAEVHWTGAVVPAGATRSLSLIIADARRAYRQGEAIPLQLVRREKVDNPEPVAVTVRLQCGTQNLATAATRVTRQTALQLPAALTQRLAPGAYMLTLAAEGYACYALPLAIAAGQADSPMQRIMYHEMGPSPAVVPTGTDLEVQLDFQRQWMRKAADLGFSRETDRNMGPAWGSVQTPASLDHPGLPADGFFRVPRGTHWAKGNALDLATQYGITLDSQLLAHCSGVRFRDYWFDKLTPVLQHTAQSRERYPSFYGINYNDEMFFGQWVFDWTESDKAWLKETAQAKFKGSMPDTYRFALRTMYDTFDAATLKANPAVRRTATPMWQFPAVEGSYAPEIYQRLSESYAHFLSEGYQLPWYAPHSGEFLRRPGLPLMVTVTHAVGWSDYDAYLKNTLQVLFRGAQGVGVGLVGPFDVANNAAAVRTANYLATAYGPIFAECPPLNEGAILYSYTQDVTERRRGFCTPHWDSVFACYGAGLMTGAPMTIIYEEDVANGWLLQNGKPRVPLLCLAGVKVALPDAVRAAIAAFTAAGGKIVIDRESAEVPGALRIAASAFINYNQGYASDTAWPMILPQLEAFARAFREAVAAQRRYPLDTDSLWVSKNVLDGGAVRYVGLASETEPFPWDAGAHWSLRGEYNYTVQPKTVTLTLPARGGVVYDVFAHTLVTPKAAGATMTLAADLTVLPGKLYALAPAALGAPRLAVNVTNGTLHYAVQVVDGKGAALAARVPLHLRLTAGDAVALDIYRGTNAQGRFAGTMPVPVNAPEWTLTVSELLGAKATRTTVRTPAATAPLLAPRDDVERFRDDRLHLLLTDAKAQGALTLVTARADVLSPAQQQALAQALLVKAGIVLKIGPAMPKDTTAGTYLAAGHLDNAQGDLLAKAAQNDLFPYPVTAHTPGPGRGVITAVFAPRGASQEQAIALLGGDAVGLAKAVDAFIAWLGTPEPGFPPLAYAPTLTALGAPATVTEPVPSTLYGARLTGISVSDDGKRLLVTGKGLLKNLVVLEDGGATGTVVRAARIGQGQWVDSAFISGTGATVGGSVRETARYGEGFHLIDTATGTERIFANFGDSQGRRTHHFAVSADGNTVLAPGAYGVACWRRRGDAWQEAWAIDYWKTFAKLDWPLHDTDERIPQFHAYIPKGADYAVILFGETTNNAWIKPEYAYGAAVFAVSLADGRERWRFDVPILKQLLFPSLYTSPDGAHLLLQVQIGSWGAQTTSYHFYNLDARTGTLRGDWASKAAPLSFSVADGSGSTAAVYTDRRVEVRAQDGTPRLTLETADQPLSVVFVAGGQGILTTDDAGTLTSYDPAGQVRWRQAIGGQHVLATSGERLYTAGRDGRVRAFTAAGTLLWTTDCTPHLTGAAPMALVAQPSTAPVHRVQRAATTTPQVPAGDNLLATGKAKLTVGGTRGWMSQGGIAVKPEALTNGKTDDVTEPIVPFTDLFWDAYAGRQVWMQIDFAQPTDVEALTVYENPAFPDAFPTEALVQVWDETAKKWHTVAFEVFLNGAVNTYPLHLKGVGKLRYVPWGNYYRNFYTSEIEVR